MDNKASTGSTRWRSLAAMASPKTEIKRFMRAQPRPKVHLSFILENVEDPVNVGAVFRIADACGAKQVVLSGISALPPHKLITKVGRGKERRVPWVSVPSVEEAIAEVKAAGYTVLATEITPEAAAYCEQRFPNKTCLLVGHEDYGVTKKTRALCDGAVFIPMYGKGASLNVHVALAVTAFAALHQDRRPPEAEESAPLG